MKARTLLVVLALACGLLAGALPVPAEQHGLVIRVDGMACSFCAYGLEKKLKRMEGVENLDVDLEAGEVKVFLKPGATVSEEALRRVVVEAGFSPREIRPLGAPVKP